MRPTDDPEADAIYVRLVERPPGEPAVARTEEIEPNLMLDCVAAGRVIGVEVLGLRARAADDAGPPITLNVLARPAA